MKVNVGVQCTAEAAHKSAGRSRASRSCPPSGGVMAWKMAYKCSSGEELHQQDAAFGARRIDARGLSHPLIFEQHHGSACGAGDL
jgi:hypothetical protein